MSKFTQLLKIAGGLLASFVIVSFISPRLFVENTPALNVEYIASLKEIPNGLRELPSKTSTYFASLFNFSNASQTPQEQEKQLQKFTADTGAVEVPLSAKEVQQAGASAGQPVNPAPNAVFKYISTGVAASEPDPSGKVIIRIDPETQKNIQYKRFKRPDGTYLDIMLNP